MSQFNVHINAQSVCNVKVKILSQWGNVFRKLGVLCELPKGQYEVLPTEIRRTDSGDDVLGPPVRGFEECCELPHRGPGLRPGRSTIFLYFDVSRQLILLRH